MDVTKSFANDAYDAKLGGRTESLEVTEDLQLSW